MKIFLCLALLFALLCAGVSADYLTPNTGTCTGVGATPITSKAECEAAASSLGLSDVVADEGTSAAHFPPGCFWYKYENVLKYNKDTTSTSPCDYHSEYCICFVAPICLETDGTTPNTAPCECGNTGCTDDTGLHCYASDNVCHNSPPCTVTDGSIANTDSCGCGNEECTAETGLICYSVVGGGSCRKNDVGAFGYPRPDIGRCTDVGAVPLTSKAECEAAASSLGLSEHETYYGEVLDNEVPGLAPGCSYSQDANDLVVYYNPYSYSTALCSGFGRCICFATCETGFHSNGYTCVANNCECPNGILNTGTCTSDGAHFCESCYTGYYLYEQSCYACRPGTYQDQADCNVCEVDAFSPAGETTCDYTVNTCPVGTYASGTASCTSCAAGKYNDQTGKTSEADCKSCADGQYSAPGEEVCSHSTCPKGTDGTDGQCTPCTAGKYNDKPGQACEVCHDTTDIMTKKHSTVGQSSCVYTVTTCPAGTYAVTSTQSCENCPVGKYSEQQGRMSASHCTACAVGTYNSKTGQNAQSACKNCGSGKTSSVNNDDCEACAAGKYSDASCKDCSAGRFSGQAADSCTDCNVGTYSPLGASDCEYTVTTCPAGTYATSTAACEQCPSGYYSQTGQSCTGCESGKFSSAGQSHCNPPTQKTSGKCTIPLTTADICLEAAQALILTGIQSSLYGTSRSATDVPGCTYDSFWAEYGIGMKFNINPDSTGDCTQGKTCICLKPVCTCLNGTPESEACTEDGAEHCKTCDDGFDLDENNACVDIDDCASDPCQNGGTCTDKVNAFSCACASGYEGDTCVTDINECTTDTDDCDVNADCANNVGSYTCTCMDGYHGSGYTCTDWGGTCDNGELIAQSSRTQDDHCGKCDSGFGRNTTYQCEACSDTDYKYSTGFDPSACVDHIECEAGQGSNHDQLDNPSTEQSVCVTCGQGTFSAGLSRGPCDPCGDSQYQTEAGQDQCNACTASCGTGYHETTACTVTTDRVCTQNVCTCENGVKATGDACTQHGAKFCESCSDGWSGQDCETNIDDCASDPCKNGGICTDKVYDFSCECDSGYTDKDCQTAHPCTTRIESTLTECESDEYFFDHDNKRATDNCRPKSSVHLDYQANNCCASCDGCLCAHLSTI